TGRSIVRTHIHEEENDMKILVSVCFALSLLISGMALAQGSMSQDNSMQANPSPKAVKIMGKISDDGKMFVSDKDGKSWKIVNPDKVKGHEGHHVVLTAHVYPDKNEVHVMSLKMASDTMKKNDM
ncbi:MAG: hypothetical protein WA824_11690, partial [Candidatus Sulfotelmatobacter sp.]